jgi:hypothetical protein
MMTTAAFAERVEVPVAGLLDVSDSASMAHVLAPSDVAGRFAYNPSGSAVASFGLSSLSPLFNGVDGKAAGFWQFTVATPSADMTAMMDSPDAEWHWAWSNMRVLNGMGVNPADFQTVQMDVTHAGTFDQVNGGWMQDGSTWSYATIDWTTGTGTFAFVTDDVSMLGLNTEAFTGWISAISGDGSMLEGRGGTPLPLPTPAMLTTAGLLGFVGLRRRRLTR